MGQFKKFLFLHGEKVVLAVVLLLCLLSLVGIIRQATNLDRVFVEGQSEPYTVSVASVTADVQRVEARIRDDSPRLDRPGVGDRALSRLRAAMTLNPQKIPTPSLAQWRFYHQPPPTGISFYAAPPQNMDPPVDEIASVANAEAYSLYAGHHAVVIMAQDPSLESGLNRAITDYDLLVMRMQIGEARDDLSRPLTDALHVHSGIRNVTDAMAKDYASLAAKDESDTTQATAPTTGAAFTGRSGEAYFPARGQNPSDSPWGQIPGMPNLGANAPISAGGSEGQTGTMVIPSTRGTLRNEGTAAMGGGMGLRAYENADYQLDVHIEDLALRHKVADPATLRAQTWELVGVMQAYNPEDIRYFARDGFESGEKGWAQACLVDGALPPGEDDDPSGLAPGTAASAESAETTPSVAPGAVTVTTGPATGVPATVAPLLGGGAPSPAPAAGAAEPAAAPKESDREYKPRYRAFLDKNLQPNTLYRYRLVARARPKDIPADERAKMEYRNYMTRVEQGEATMRTPGMQTLHPSTLLTEGLLAPADTEWEAFLTASSAKPPMWIPFGSRQAIEALSIDASARPPVFRGMPIKFDERTGRIVGMTRQDGTLTALAAAYRDGATSRDAQGRKNGPYVYSLPLHTTAVLTRLSRRLDLTSVRPGTAGGAALASFMVEIYQENGEVMKSPRFQVSPPPGVQGLDLQRWIVRDEFNNPVFGPDGEVMLRTLEEYYGDLKQLSPVPIGGMGVPLGSKRGTPEVDFSSGWGLVDLGEGRITRIRYREDPRNPGVMKELPTLHVKLQYAVVCELNPPADQKPRYRYIALKRNVAAEPNETQIWNWTPELKELTDALKKQRAEQERRQREQNAPAAP